VVEVRSGSLRGGSWVNPVLWVVFFVWKRTPGP
jgi:hypothetical protein